MNEQIRHEKGIYEFVGSNRKERFLFKQQVAGKMLTKSFKTLRLAKAEKTAFNAKIKRYGKISTEFNDQDWAELKAARRDLPDGVSLQDVVKFYTERHATGNNLTMETCTKLFVVFQTKRNNSRRYGQTVQSSMNKLLEYVPAKFVRSVTRNQLAKALDAIGETLSERSVLNHRGMWSHFFNWLVDTQEIFESPMKTITLNILPKSNRVNQKNPLEVDQVKAIMALAEKEFPHLAYWFALQFFVGFRSGEANRFQHEWVQPEFNRIVIPAWFKDEDGNVQGATKTRDSWMIDKVPENFWAWHSRYGKPRGSVETPGNNYQWDHKVRKPILAAGIVKEWPHNAKRDSFCTYHLSAYRDEKQTALILKHRNTNTLWNSYMGTLRTEKEGKAYFSILPEVK